MKRKIIQIDEEKCNGCGVCIPNCHEGAMQIIDGKAKLISDLFCDGLGACLGHCPEGAIAIIEREAEPYDEQKVMEKMSVSKAVQHSHGEAGCPGSMTKDFRKEYIQSERTVATVVASELRQWPVQLHLLNPQASYFKNADVVMAADCVAFAMGNFHERFLKGKSIAIACPKLDSNKESYIQKLSSMIADAKINSLTVVMMEVPCCGSLLYMAQTARTNAGRNVPIKQAIVSLQGEVVREEWT